MNTMFDISCFQTLAVYENCLHYIISSCNLNGRTIGNDVVSEKKIWSSGATYTAPFREYSMLLCLNQCDMPCMACATLKETWQDSLSHIGQER
jgi:hypothetical protein